MLKALGYPILAVGLVMGLQTFIPTAPAPFVPAPVDKDIALLPPPAAAPAPRTQPAIVAPRPVLAARTKPTNQAASNATTASATVTVSPWRTAVVAFHGTGDAQTAITSSTASSGADRYELARNIQRELKRVGCYYGEIDGSWGAGSKRALTTFMDRVNASLPITEPDYILLALIRAQPATACSVPCPQGQTHANDGRCVPNAILAQTMKRNGVADTAAPAPAPGAADTHVAWTAEVRPSAGAAPDLPPPAPLFGRMSIGGPRSDRATVAVGDTPADGLAVPARNGAAYTTASLPDGDDPSSETDAANLSAQGMVAPAVVPTTPRVKASKPARRYVSRARSVQQIFMHPLGRM